MTLATTESQSLDSHSPDSFWESEELPPPVLEESPTDETQLINPSPNTCPTCGEEIVREPGSRGRLPKYHPECRPSKSSSAKTSGPRPVRVTAKDRAVAEQVEQILEQYERQINKAVMLIAVADPYDAFVLKVNTPDLLNNMRPILMRYPMLRDGASTSSIAIAVLNLVITVLVILLPIASHHGFIGKGKVAQIMLNIPLFMLRVQQNMENGEGDLTDTLLARVREQQQQQQQQEMRRRTAETVNATNAR
jgi:hypothetical protein